MSDNSKRSFRAIFSADVVVEAVNSAFRRFPVTVVTLCFFTVWLWIEFWLDFSFSDSVEIAFSIFFSMELLMSAAVNVWADLLGLSTRKRNIAQIVCGIVMAVDFGYLIFNGRYLGTVGSVGHAAAATAAIVALFFVPATKRFSRRATWTFSRIQFDSLCASAVVGMLMALAGLVIFFTLEALFGIKIGKVLSTYEILACLTVPAMLFLSRIPSGKDMEHIDYGPSSFATGVAKFVVLPLCAVYMLILYVYGLDILYNWNLPKGMICVSVTGLVAVVLLTFFLLVDQAGAKWKKVVRALAVAMFPLLVMMSVSIGYRIACYGITPDRAYVLLFNLWAYGAMIYLYLRSGSGINNIAISFAAVFLLVSILPRYNATELSDSYIRWRAKAILASYSYKHLPLDRKTFTAALDKMSREDRGEFLGKIRYLAEWNNPGRTADIADFPVMTSRFEFEPLFEIDDTVEVESYYKEIVFKASEGSARIPDGCTNVVSVYESSWKPEGRADGEYIVNAEGYEIPLRFMSLDTITSRTALPDTLIHLRGNQGVFMPKSIEYRIDLEDNELDYYRVSGYIFF